MIVTLAKVLKEPDDREARLLLVDWQVAVCCLFRHRHDPWFSDAVTMQIRLLLMLLLHR